MTKLSIHLRLAPVLALLLGAACAKDEPAPAVHPPAKAPAKTAPEAATLPASAPAPTGARAIDSETGLHFDVPEGWSSFPPTSRSRVAELVPPRATGDPEDARLVVSYFANGAGSPEANVGRWRGQMRSANGMELADTDVQVRSATLGGVPSTIFEARGTYLESQMPGGPTREIPKAAMFAVQIEGTHGAWFLKLTGPEGTVLGARAGFEALLASIRIAP